MTSDQFWCVVLSSGAFGALIGNAGSVQSFVPTWLVVLFTALLAAWGVFFIRNRHRNWVDLQEKFAELVKDLADVPADWRRNSVSFRKSPLGHILGEFLPGYGAYQMIIGALAVAAVLRYV